MKKTKTRQPNRAGRPSLSGQHISPRIALRLPAETMAAVEQEAAAAGLTVSAWAREVMTRSVSLSKGV